MCMFLEVLRKLVSHCIPTNWFTLFWRSVPALVPNHTDTLCIAHSGAVSHPLAHKNNSQLLSPKPAHLLQRHTHTHTEGCSVSVDGQMTPWLLSLWSFSIDTLYPVPKSYEKGAGVGGCAGAAFAVHAEGVWYELQLASALHALHADLEWQTACLVRCYCSAAVCWK